MFGLGMGEVLIVLAFALIFIGPKKLPELARSLGKGLVELQRSKDDFIRQIDHAGDEDDESKSKTDDN